MRSRNSIFVAPIRLSLLPVCALGWFVDASGKRLRGESSNRCVFIGEGQE
jgi:hypothetical protein